MAALSTRSVSDAAEGVNDAVDAADAAVDAADAAADDAAAETGPDANASSIADDATTTAADSAPSAARVVTRARPSARPGIRNPRRATGWGVDPDRDRGASAPQRAGRAVATTPAARISD